MSAHDDSGDPKLSGAGWIAFGVLAALWPPLWFLGFLDLPRDAMLIGIASGAVLSIDCAVIRAQGAPRLAWTILVCVGVATVLWSLAIGLGERSGDPWADRYLAFLIGMGVLIVLAHLPYLILVKRRADAARSGSRPGSAP